MSKAIEALAEIARGADPETRARLSGWISDYVIDLQAHADVDEQMLTQLPDGARSHIESRLFYEAGRELAKSFAVAWERNERQGVRIARLKIEVLRD